MLNPLFCSAYNVSISFAMVLTVVAFVLFLCLGRDEIYCQICKQLVKNRNRKSLLQGWTLLSICLGIFPPTDLFMKVSLQQVKWSNLEENAFFLRVAFC